MKPLRLLAAALLLGSGFARAYLVADYGFQNVLSSSVAGAPDLVPLLPGDGVFAAETIGGAARIARSFSSDAGFHMSTDGVIDNDGYSVAWLMRFDMTSGYRKIMDTYARLSDLGLYVLSDDLTLYPVTSVETGRFTAQEWHQVVFTRDAAGMVAGYVDGYLQFRATDSTASSLISADQVLTFFADDGGGEHSAGAVARIRVWDHVLSERFVAALDDNQGERIFIDGMETL